MLSIKTCNMLPRNGYFMVNYLKVESVHSLILDLDEKYKCLLFGKGWGYIQRLCDQFGKGEEK